MTRPDPPQAGEDMAELEHREQVPVPEVAAPATGWPTFVAGTPQQAMGCGGGTRTPPLSRLGVGHGLEDVDLLMTVRAKGGVEVLVDENDMGTRTAELAHALGMGSWKTLDGGDQSP